MVCVEWRKFFWLNRGEEQINAGVMKEGDFEGDCTTPYQSKYEKHGDEKWIGAVVEEREGRRTAKKTELKMLSVEVFVCYFFLCFFLIFFCPFFFPQSTPAQGHSGLASAPPTATTTLTIRNLSHHLSPSLTPGRIFFIFQ